MSTPKHRSGCRVSVSLELLGDRWFLVIVRELLVRDFRTYKQFLKSSEGIATNSLADRQNKLESTGIITAEKVETDGRKVHLRLTDKRGNRENVLTETRRRWRQRDLTPLIPKFIKENHQ